MSERNALAGETSPYLLQHADNPVQWYPWNESALAKAREEDKPILLSVGYSACHWCHVMAHESFEDEDTARIMNEHFVSIKVDREERPDLDKIYQVAHQLLTQRAGGWPLTMFLTPDDQRPFFGGTYFPEAPRFGMPAFADLLLRVAEYYAKNRDDIHKQNESLVEALRRLEPEPGQHDLVTPRPLEAARAELRQAFDERFGGFAGAPKFPHPTSSERLLRHFAATAADGNGDASACREAIRTLSAMSLGGIYDHLGGGFCRYSVDERWMIPHFEKMLYDNGPLLALVSEAWQITGEPLFRQVAMETGEWVLREMQSPEGGYYSTLDADSEGEEGKYYVWTPQQVQGLLEEDEYRCFARRFGLDSAPNFEGKHWHLHVYVDYAEIGKELGIDAREVKERIDRARAKLFEAREKRVRPGRDEKILTSWNALMIKGMASAARILGEPRFADSGERALEFAHATMWQDGRLLATYKDGRAHLPAYLDDYAFLIDAILTLLTCRWRRDSLDFAVELAEVLLTQFEDADNGGFYFTAHEHETLIHRPKPYSDDALPAGNGIAAYALGRLGHLLGEHRYLEAAERTIRAAWPALSRIPHAHNALLLALEEYLEPPQTIVIRGKDKARRQWLQRCHAHFAPRRLAVAIASAEEGLPGLLAERAARAPTVAYVCEGHTCKEPITKLKDLDRVLAETEISPEAS